MIKRHLRKPPYSVGMYSKCYETAKWALICEIYIHSVIHRHWGSLVAQLPGRRTLGQLRRAKRTGLVELKRHAPAAYTTARASTQCVPHI